jgi:hypothetical protein
MTAEEWRERLATLPQKEIQRLLKSEPLVMAQISAGFRPGVETLKNPIVLKRLAEALPKNPKLAEALEAVPIPEPVPSASPHPARTHPASSLGDPPSSKEGELKAKLREQRAALRERDAELTELRARLGQCEKERDAALVERDSERKARETREAQLERERRRKVPEPVVVKASAPTATAPTLAAEPPTSWLPEALSRLLQRGHDATVLTLCRELLTDDSLPLVARAGIQGAYALALDSLGAPDAVEQSRIAAEAFLSAGQPLEASEALLRSFTRSTPSTAERALLQKLVAMAERRGELEALSQSWLRQRLTRPAAFACLTKGLENVGKKYPQLLPEARATTLVPDATVALPTTSKSVATVTARKLVQAVDEGAVALVSQARAGLQALRTSDPGLADALLEAVGRLSPPSLATLTATRLRPIVVDASNVARHIGDPLAALVTKKATGSTTQLVALREFLLLHGFFPVICIADANLRHVVTEKAAYAALVERHIVRETLPGTSADELLLTEAHAHNAPLLTNDRLTDWGKQADGIERLGFTIHKNTVTLLPV